MSSWPVLVFDIESIPDVAGLRNLRQMDTSVDDAAVYDAEIADRAARGKGDFMPLYLQRVLVISCVFRNAEGLRVHSLVDREVGGASQEGLGLPMLLAFVIGLLVSNSLIVLITATGFIASRARERLYVGVGVIAGLFSLVIGAIFLFDLQGALPPLDGFLQVIGAR